MTHKPLFLTDAQLKEEIGKCEYCEEKPCKEACPCDCSPADFIMAAKLGRKGDYKRAAALIMGSNPLGGVCGSTCPEWYCMKACVHRQFDAAVNIPAVQATIVQKAKELGAMPSFARAASNGRKVAVVGGGPAGLAAAAALAQMGYSVQVYEAQKEAGGMSGLIPDCRLDKGVLRSDVEWLMGLGDIRVKTASEVKEPEKLLSKGFDAVIVAAGLPQAVRLPIPGADKAKLWTDFLRSGPRLRLKGRRVAILGGGAVAVDCAEAAVGAGAEHVELFSRRKLGEMSFTAKERQALEELGVALTGRVSPTAILTRGGKVEGLGFVKVDLVKGKKPRSFQVEPVKGSEHERRDFDTVVFAVGSRGALRREPKSGLFFAGDLENGPTSVVEASAAGKNAAVEADAWLRGAKAPQVEKKTKSRHTLAGRRLLPVPLEAEFFGRKIISPFLLSAAPHSDGYEQMKKAYEAGWAGGVMKTAFDGVPIHIPGEYMFSFNESTYANCDNVSGHPLDRVCREIDRLVKEFPDRLTMASTGGPVTGNDEADAKGWRHNTRKLEETGVMGIEYSLSCPQGGDGTKGDIVSQDPELTAKIVDWVMGISDPDVPKLFKLTGAVTAIYPVLKAIKDVFDRYPGKKAGVTLANSFPSLAFRPGRKATWDEGVVVGMSGEGVLPISCLTLANASRVNVAVSGNGGPMDYKAAADFLALGAKTVQFCTIVMKHGYGIVGELGAGLSHLMEERGFGSVKELIGSALPDPITGFMELSALKKVSAVRAELCRHCGNCARCPYLAIALDKDKVPLTDPAKCIGCSICVQKCFSGALFMRERTKKELAALREH